MILNDNYYFFSFSINIINSLINTYIYIFNSLLLFIITYLQVHSLSQKTDYNPKTNTL